jgi:D-glycerate 3-kinase
LKIKKKPNIVIFEGWCVGVEAQKNKDLIIPINKLEKQRHKKKFGENKLI